MSLYCPFIVSSFLALSTQDIREVFHELLHKNGTGQIRDILPRSWTRLFGKLSCSRLGSVSAYTSSDEMPADTHPDRQPSIYFTHLLAAHWVLHNRRLAYTKWPGPEICISMVLRWRVHDHFELRHFQFGPLVIPTWDPIRISIRGRNNTNIGKPISSNKRCCSKCWHHLVRRRRHWKTWFQENDRKNNGASTTIDHGTIVNPRLTANNCRYIKTYHLQNTWTTKQP